PRRCATACASGRHRWQRQAGITIEHIAKSHIRKEAVGPQLAQEIGSQFSTRIEGTCIKHRFASSSIKMYDAPRAASAAHPLAASYPSPSLTRGARGEGWGECLS